MGLMETSSARAWAEFRTRLAEHLDDLDDAAEVRLVVPGAGAAHPAIVVRRAEGRLLAEVAGAEPSASDEGTLLTLGWAVAPEIRASAHPVEADRLAVLVVRTLREVFDVLHPSFLTCDVAHLLEQPEDAAGADAVGAQPPTVQFPTDRDQVVAMVDATLAWFLGHEPFKDDDLDIPIVCGESVVYVRVLDDSVVLVQSDVVCDVADGEAARFEVNVLNREHPDVQFSHLDATVQARRRLSSYPYVAQQVHDAVEEMCALVEDVADDLAHRVSGRLCLDETPVGATSRGDVEPSAELATMIELEAGRPGSLDAELVAGIYQRDRDLLLSEIEVVREPWQLELLRAALRHLVEADVARLRDAGRRLPRQRRGAVSDDVAHRPVRD